MFDRRPNALGYAVIVASGATVALGGAAVTLGGTRVLATSALVYRLFWGVLVPTVVVVDGSLAFLFGVRLEYYLLAVILLAAGFLAFLVLVLPGLGENEDPEFSRRR